jgi:hypothetical protein
MPGSVHASIAVSLDGFVAGPNDRVGNGLGDGGERLHEWMFESASWRERHGQEGGEHDLGSEVPGHPHPLSRGPVTTRAPGSRSAALG